MWGEARRDGMQRLPSFPGHAHVWITSLRNTSNLWGPSLPRFLRELTLHATSACTRNVVASKATINIIPVHVKKSSFMRPYSPERTLR